MLCDVGFEEKAEVRGTADGRAERSGGAAAAGGEAERRLWNAVVSLKAVNRIKRRQLSRVKVDSSGVCWDGGSRGRGGRLQCQSRRGEQKNNGRGRGRGRVVDRSFACPSAFTINTHHCIHQPDTCTGNASASHALLSRPGSRLNHHHLPIATMPGQTYLTHLSAFTHFLTAYIHTLLHLRSLYPPTSFLATRFHNTPIHQSRVPAVCTWILDAVAAVRDELLRGAVDRIAIVVYHPGGGEEWRDSASSGGSEGKGSVKILERYMLDVSAFPALTRAERFMDIEWADEASTSNPDQQPPAVPAEADDDTSPDPTLSQQFRAALLALTTRTSRLAPLPAGCSFTVSMELKDDPSVNPPVEHPQKWVPVQPSLQKTGVGGARDADGARDAGASASGERSISASASQPTQPSSNEGTDLGGARVTPLRTVEAGVFRFETWVEEGKAKFDMINKAKAKAKSTSTSAGDSFASSVV